MEVIKLTKSRIEIYAYISIEEFYQDWAETGSFGTIFLCWYHPSTVSYIGQFKKRLNRL